jgi:hypothetical protein
MVLPSPSVAKQIVSPSYADSTGTWAFFRGRFLLKLPMRSEAWGGEMMNCWPKDLVQANQLPAAVAWNNCGRGDMSPRSLRGRSPDAEKRQSFAIFATRNRQTRRNSRRIDLVHARTVIIDNLWVMAMIS